MITRRRLLQGAAGLAGGSVGAGLAGGPVGAGLAGGPVGAALAAFEGERPVAEPPVVLHALSGKRPLIKRTYRPPNYETPLADLAAPLTPNDAFFVRYHLAHIPVLTAEAWRLRVAGEAAGSPYELTLADLQQLPVTEITAVCQCLGMARGLAETRVPGLPWGRGALGNARWRGVRLRDVLARARPGSAALEVVLHGADGPPRPTLPDFSVSLPLERARHPDTLIAWAMNGADLPLWNGYPVRLVVPGWGGRYWMKHLTGLELVTRPLRSYWMDTAYRVPQSAFPDQSPFPSQDQGGEKAITDVPINCLVTSPADGARVRARTPFVLRGHAWDGGRGIAAVQISDDGGARWRSATLGDDLGPYAFRPWDHAYTPAAAGPLVLLARAVGRDGRIQPPPGARLPAGYPYHAVYPLRLDVEAA